MLESADRAPQIQHFRNSGLPTVKSTYGGEMRAREGSGLEKREREKEAGERSGNERERTTETREEILR